MASPMRLARGASPHRCHVHSAQRGRSSRPGCPVLASWAPDPGNGEERRPGHGGQSPRDEEPPTRPRATTADDRDEGVSLIGISASRVRSVQKSREEYPDRMPQRPPFHVHVWGGTDEPRWHLPCCR
jgi:hypothetical protein